MADYGAHLNEFSSPLRAEPGTKGAIAESDPNGGKQMYYRHKRDGRITTGAAWDKELVRQARKGMEPIFDLGNFDLENKDEPGGPWNINREPYRRVFAAGMQHIFSVDQIIEHGWHRKPPYRGVEFPQLEGVQIDEAKCRRCRKPYVVKVTLTDGEVREYDSLERHVQIAHKESSHNEQLGSAIAGAATAGAGPMAEALAQLGQGMAAMQQSVAQQGAVLLEVVKTLADLRKPAEPAAPVEAPTKPAK
jgi:hypothetical protein